MADFNSITNSEFLINTDVQADATSTNNNNLYDNKFYGEFFAGFGCQFCSNLYLGARAGVNFSKFNIKRKELVGSNRPEEIITFSLTHETSQETSIQQAEFTFDGKFGWIICEKTMIYGLVGVALNKPKLVIESTGEFLSQTDSTLNFQNQLTISSKDQNYRTNFRYGGGIEQFIGCNLSIHLSYSYTDYGRLSSILNGTQIINSGDILSIDTDTKVKIKRHALLAGFTRYF